MDIGVQGDFSRGVPTAVGMETPLPFGIASLDIAAEKNPRVRSFLISVNPFFVDRARRVAQQWRDLNEDACSFEVHGNSGFPADAYLISPSRRG